MMTPINNSLVIVLSLLSLTFFGSDRVEAAGRSPVDMKCEFTYWDANSDLDKTFIQKMKLAKEINGRNMNYVVDQVENLKIAGKPNLKIWIDGNYFHNENEVNSYLRLKVSVCEEQSGGNEVKCLGSAYSGDVFANTVKAQTIYKGKKLQMAKLDMNIKEAPKSLDILVNYRLKTGSPLFKNLDVRDEAQLKLYNELMFPIVSVTCSVRDDAFGVQSAFEE